MMLKGIFLARLLDQPLAYRYPSALLEVAKNKNIISLKRWIEARMHVHPRCRVYQDLWWEFQGAIGDYKSILKSPTPRKVYSLATKRGYPISYIDETEFMGCKIKVNPPILIPRPDTESWLQNLVPSVLSGGYTSVLDIGFGSGCISVGLARVLGPNVGITGIDRSRYAFALAQKNKTSNSLNNVNFVLCDIGEYSGTHEVVVSNPPYIRHCDRSVNVSPSARRWESASALHPPRLEPDDGACYHKVLIDMVKCGAIGGCKILAMELDGTKTQYDIVLSYVRKIFENATVEPISDGRKKYRAIKITL